ncbi:exopolysaccharide production repressor protein [Pseudorhizobium tarimense]|uniref:Exopolysaccharide production repressor protein n=1 Tax=Pseudorhizobium tarimense TaxID=1079109 RepID=A0ABV2H0X4_9HYPH|nr:exopolysaccharide production repressor protein [Pseudorhizobium tarimense]MCJ8517476.1 exopolysaccharide production repressor protein [Pseudorhizobium tarimense]
MYAPRVFFSMICVLLVFAVAAFWQSGSLLTALLSTVVCAVLLQVGYFVGILYLVRQEKRHRSGAAEPSHPQQAVDAHAADDIPADAARH